MTSHRTKISKMQASSKEKKIFPCKGKSNVAGTDKPRLPLLKKSVYMDVKPGKQAKTIEEQLKKLGANVEKFLSREVNYVISSFAPVRHEERPSTGEDNPQSPSFVPSPFSCGPSPLASSDAPKSLVSRGKTIAQIACAKKQTASTVISSAEKLGIKVVSVEVANKWLDKELKKLEKDCSKDKKENNQDKQKTVRRKRKILRGAYIKFEACNRMYRPIKSELDRWPKLNPLAPPGLNPFTEVKMKAPHAVSVRRQLLLRNKRTSCKGVLSHKIRVKKSCSKSVTQDSGIIKTSHAMPDLVGVPITTTGDVKRNMENHWKKRPDKMQGYCECCEIRYKNLNQHLNEEEHQSYARNKSNYESLDRLISEILSPIDFMTNLVLQHCSQKQNETQPKYHDKQVKDALPALFLNVASPISSLKTGNEETGTLNMCTPQPDQDTGTDVHLHSGEREKEEDKVGKEKSDKRPQAVVIRRPSASGIFTSPRRRQPTPSKKPWVQERCMVFRDSPLASLQPSSLLSKITSDMNETLSVSPFTAGKTKQSGSQTNRCLPENDRTDSKSEESSVISVGGPDLSMKSTNGKHQVVIPTSILGGSDLPLKSTGVKEQVEVISKLTVGDTDQPMKSTKGMEQREAIAVSLSGDAVSRNTICSYNQKSVQKKKEMKSETENALEEEEKGLNSTEIKTVPGIADRVKTRTRKNTIGEKYDEKEQQPSNIKSSCNTFHGKSVMTSNEVKNCPTALMFDTISSGKSRCDEITDKSKAMAGSISTKNNGLEVIHGGIRTNDLNGVGHVTRCSLTISNEKLELAKNSIKVTASNVYVEEDKQINFSQIVNESDNHCTPEKNKPFIHPERSHNEGIEASVDYPKRRRRKIKKDVNRILFVDTSDQQSPLGNSPHKHTPIKTYNLENICSESDHVVAAEKAPASEVQDKMSESEIVLKEDTDKNLIYHPHFMENVARSVKENVRQCKLFVHEGKYAHDGEGVTPPSDNVHRKIWRTPSRKIKRQKSTDTPVSVVNTKHGDKKDGNIENSETNCAKHQLSETSKIKSYERKIHTSVDWNKEEKSENSPGSADNETADHDNLAVPNIAERVKGRRSCTDFNHVGQYANGGIGIETLTPKSRKLVQSQRKILKAKKRLRHFNNSRSSETREKVKNRKHSAKAFTVKNKSRSPAIVVRRIRPSFKTLSQSSEANWCKYLSDKDWSQCESETDSSFSSNNVKGRSQPELSTQEHPNYMALTSMDNDDQAQTKNKNKDNLHCMQDTSQNSSLENKDTNLRQRKKLTPDKKASIKSRKLPHLKKSHASFPCESSHRNLASSPRLRLTIQRDSVNESYSTTLEEIYDDKCHIHDSPSRIYAMDTVSSNQDKKASSASLKESEIKCNISHTRVCCENTTPPLLSRRQKEITKSECFPKYASPSFSASNQRQIHINDREKKNGNEYEEQPAHEMSNKDVEFKDEMASKKVKAEYSSSKSRKREKTKMIEAKWKKESRRGELETGMKNINHTTVSSLCVESIHEESGGGKLNCIPGNKTPKYIDQSNEGSVRNSTKFVTSDTTSAQTDVIIDNKEHQSSNESKLEPVMEIPVKGEQTGIEPETKKAKTRHSRSFKKRKRRKAKNSPFYYNLDHTAGSRSEESGDAGAKISQTYMLPFSVLHLEDSVEKSDDRLGHVSMASTSKEHNMITNDSAKDECLNGGYTNTKAENKSLKIEMKSQKSRKQKRKNKRKLFSREDCLPSKKKRKVSDPVTGDSFNAVDDTENGWMSNKTGKSSFDINDVPEFDTSEVDFPKLNKEKIKENKDNLTHFNISFKKTHKKHCKTRDDSSTEMYEEDNHIQSGLTENNLDTSFNSNLGDLLAFVPTFSSPGKTNSSWDDACDSYLNTSAKLDHTSTNQNTPSTAQLSPSPVTPYPHQPESSSLRSPNKKTQKKAHKHYFSPDIFNQFSSPTKRKSANVASLDRSPVIIEKVDADISFNHMSPQRLQFSPVKCEKSTSHKRNLNSPSKNL